MRVHILYVYKRQHTHYLFIHHQKSRHFYLFYFIICIFDFILLFLRFVLHDSHSYSFPVRAKYVGALHKHVACNCQRKVIWKLFKFLQI